MNRNKWRWWVARPLLSWLFFFGGGFASSAFLLSGNISNASANYHANVPVQFLWTTLSPSAGVFVTTLCGIFCAIMVTVSFINLVMFGRIVINPAEFAMRLSTRKDSFYPWFRFYEEEDRAPTERFFDFFGKKVSNVR